MTAVSLSHSGVPQDSADRRGTRLDSLVAFAAEIALVLLSVTAAVGMTRLFADDTFLRDVLALALASHLVAVTSRRTALGLTAAALISGVCWAVTATVLRYGATAWYAVPTAETLHAVRVDLADAWATVMTQPTPVESSPGLVLVAGSALWLGAFTADTAAFRMRVPVTALLPSSAVVVFTAAVGTGESPVLYSGVYCASAAALLVVMRLRSRDGDAAWIESRPGRYIGAIGRICVLSAGFAVGVGTVFGPSLPGADRSPWLDLNDLSVEPTTRTVVSPLVQIQSRLITQSEQEMFAVAVPEGSREYWRLMSLDIFDGVSWKARSRFAKADDIGPTTVPTPVLGPRLTQTVTIGELGNIYLPAAYEVQRVLNDGGVALEYESASGALVTVEDDLSTASASDGGFTYQVESAGPYIDSALMLQSESTGEIPADLLTANTALPADFPETVRIEAERVTRQADSDYERALLLQDYFWLGDRFVYELNVNKNRRVGDLEDFLFDVRAGYCEQFASAYAAMARSLGLPARVAVGFTWGEWDSEQGAYIVRGKHAHAWPEVYFAAAGWVRFEPTPGRGAPDDFAVTGRVAAQAGEVGEAGRIGAVGQIGEAGQVGGVGGVTELAPTPSIAEFDPEPESVSESPPTEVETPPMSATENTLTESEEGPRQPSRWVRNLVMGVMIVVLVLALPGVVVAGLRRLRRRQRQIRVADDPAGRIGLAWDDALDALSLLGLGRQPWETPAEMVKRLTSVSRATATAPPDMGSAVAESELSVEPESTVPAVSHWRASPRPTHRWGGPYARLLERLADLAVVGYYAPRSYVSTEMAQQAEHTATQIVGACRRTATRRRKLLAFFAPRPLGNQRQFNS